MLREALKLYGTEMRWVPGTRQLGDCMTKDEGVVIDAFKAAMTTNCYNIGDEGRALELRALAKEERLRRGKARKDENEKKLNALQLCYVHYQCEQRQQVLA